ncbi:PREDICTED: arrestin domain-containing protein 17 isoform X1 [Drosophila arizonae]|uniref:Arrestin domain-containing protein 17 isoform X1 n=1 Tax=Drosophila arizonae TaxID=7263 RepID=A0ABM1P2D4_DROAR|nr:PREDICTED: arrestin domain-containing protein 17 isoform X1 [Drosophila arizonae]XP_017861370.1 PREDICTED: arrestin domain-containing protein 17 isoform X1 [Drosophila arizonae]
MPIECLISFDNNPQGVYYAGQELSGVVDLSVDATKRIKGIHVTVSGYAKIRWIKKGYPRDSERAMCRAYRSYLSSRSYVLGSCAGNSCIDWLAGEYSYTFHVILPDNLPTSFDGKYGQIHYEIITTIERSGRYPKVFKLPFTVIQPLDLNADAIYKVPLEILDRKRFWSFCCPTGPLTVKFSTPYCGYAPGQKIHFVLYINNESSIDITECEVKLKQEVSYESHDPQHEYRYDKHLIALKQFGNVLRWSRKVYRGYLDLPSIPPTSVKPTCPISVNYSIKIIVNPTEFHWKLKLKIPLTIGSIPIMDGPDALLRFNRQQQQHQVVSQHFQMSTQQNQRPQRPPQRGSLQNSSNNSNNTNNNSNSNNNNNNNQATRAMQRAGAILPAQSSPSSMPTTADLRPMATMPAILVTSDSDSPPDYIPMMPPSYEDAMALSEKFSDDIEFLTNVSMSSILSAQGDVTSEREPFKPRYPVYYDYETPTIPPETLYSESSNTQIRYAVPQETDENGTNEHGTADLLNCEKK